MFYGKICCCASTVPFNRLQAVLVIVGGCRLAVFGFVSQPSLTGISSDLCCIAFWDCAARLAYQCAQRRLWNKTFFVYIPWLSLAVFVGEWSRKLSNFRSCQKFPEVIVRVGSSLSMVVQREALIYANLFITTVTPARKHGYCVAI